MNVWHTSSTDRNMAMMTGGIISPKSDVKKTWGSSSRGQESLLGMASTLFSGENYPRSFASPPPMNMMGLFPTINTAPSQSVQDITSQVLMEVGNDSMFEPPSDDIFDLEPVPIRPNHTAQQQQNSRLAMLEDTLNQVLDMEDIFLEDAPQEEVPEQHPCELTSSLDGSSTAKRQMDEDTSDCSPLSKRQRLMEEEDDAARRFRPYQAEQWSEKFAELLTFRAERGHCCVPHTFDENPSLARWVKRQRYQYKLKIENKPSTMTDERIVALEQTGFVWDSHGAAWMERWNELRDFKNEFGHANVPSNYPKSPQLATWVKCQRRQYKLFCNGKATNMTWERLQSLESTGFEWELRSGSSRGKKSEGDEQVPAIAHSHHNMASYHF